LNAYHCGWLANRLSIFRSCHTKTTMRNLRTYGNPPFSVAVIHGGPGAGGEMAPVARELADDYGVLEPIQTAGTLEGQVMELRQVLESHGSHPVTLVGFSWGAWLSFIVAARHPGLVKKLILVGSGPFEERYVPALQAARLRRLDAGERAEYEALLRDLDNPAVEDKDRLLARLGGLVLKADAFDPLPGLCGDADRVGPHGDIYQGVWDDAVKMRRSGALLRLAQHIQCPVLAVHGDADPHPAEGVEKPLAGVLADFQFVLLENCGHTPWIERRAREPFYRVVRSALS